MSTLRGNKSHLNFLHSEVVAVANPVGRVGRPRNMKSMWPLLAAIFFMAFFYRAGGGSMAPLPSPLDSLLGGDVKHLAHTHVIIVLRIWFSHFYERPSWTMTK